MGSLDLQPWTRIGTMNRIAGRIGSRFPAPLPSPSGRERIAVSLVAKACRWLSAGFMESPSPARYLHSVKSRCLLTSLSGSENHSRTLPAIIGYGCTADRLAIERIIAQKILLEVIKLSD